MLSSCTFLQEVYYSDDILLIVIFRGEHFSPVEILLWWAF